MIAKKKKIMMVKFEIGTHDKSRDLEVMINRILKKLVKLETNLNKDPKYRLHINIEDDTPIESLNEMEKVSRAINDKIEYLEKLETTDNERKYCDGVIKNLQDILIKLGL